MSTSLIKSANNIAEMRDIAARICRDYLTGAWKTITAEEIKLKKISGGLSNFLFYVSLPELNETGNSTPIRTSSLTKRPRKDSVQETNFEPKEVLLRIYGQTHGSDALEAMVTESVVFTLLSERKLGPKLHGIFPGGRIEQYIPARPLCTSELSDLKISMRIAKKMAEIHSLNIPVSKEPDWLWNTMSKWLQNIETILSNYESKKNNFNESEHYKKILSVNYREEINWLKALVERNNFPVVFSHNDMQEGNILLREDDTTLSSTPIDRFNSTMIDEYEDSAVDSHLNSILLTPKNKNQNLNMNNDSNTVSGDSNKNFFNNSNGNNNNSLSRKRLLTDDESEACELDNTVDSVLSGDMFSANEDTCDPELMIIDFEYCAYNYRGFDFANHFLEWTFDYTNENFPYFYHKKDQYPTLEQKEAFVRYYLKSYNDDNENYEPSQDEISELLDEVKCFTLASHLFWSLWSVVNVHQEIPFGYWEYAVTRINEYFDTKQAYMKYVNSKPDYNINNARL